jgi:hypothetical protein
MKMTKIIGPAIIVVEKISIFIEKLRKPKKFSEFYKVNP